MTELQTVIGYPPRNLEPRTNIMIEKSFPVVHFHPAIPQFQKGLDLFRLKSSWDDYTSLLADNGFTTPNNGGAGLRLAFLADNFPTDSFTNEYGENFLQKFTDVASEGAASIAQIMGATSMSQAYGTIAESLKAAGGLAGMMGGAMGAAGQLGGAAKSAIEQIPAMGQIAGKGITLVDRLMAGSRVDFPMVWKGSSFQPSYSMTVRLYNPYPQDPEYTQKYIIGPVTAILLLGVPRAQDASTYTWPFLHRIECDGIFKLDPGFISNITVIKGGDQQQISFNQQLGIVDVRIDVGSLYSTMMAGGKKMPVKSRPTVAAYGYTMRQDRGITSRRKDNSVNQRGEGDPIVLSSFRSSGTRGVISSGIPLQGNRNSNFQGGESGINIDRRFARFTKSGDVLRPVTPKVSQKVEDDAADQTPIDRVTDAAKEVYEKLKELGGVITGAVT